MPSTAGAVDATPTRRLLHLSFVDFNGKPRTDTYEIDASDTDAEINAFVADMGAASNANLWRVAITNEFTTGVGLASEAVNEPDDSIKDNVVVLLKNSSLDGFDIFIPAPLAAMIIDGSEDVDTEATVLTDLMDSATAIWGSYVPYSYRYSERRKKNRSKRA